MFRVLGFRDVEDLRVKGLGFTGLQNCVLGVRQGREWVSRGVRG